MRPALPFAFLIAAALACVLGCTGHPPKEETAVTQDSSSSERSAPLAEVLQRHTRALLREPGIVGTAEGRRGDRPVFLILVERKTDALARKLPREIEGYPVEVRGVGDVKALSR